MTDLPLSHREVKLELLDPANEYIRRIRERRRTVNTSKCVVGNLRGQTSEALPHTFEFTSSASDWTTDHLCRLQVVMVDGQLDGAIFPKPYILSDDDKTLITINEDGFFLPTAKDIMAHSWSSKTHNNFFIDLMQILVHREKSQISSTSPQPSTPYAVFHPNKTRAAISKALQNAKGSIPTSHNTNGSSYSLIHNFLKYIASMEHLAYPNLPFWCPR